MDCGITDPGGLLPPGDSNPFMLMMEKVIYSILNNVL